MYEAYSNCTSLTTAVCGDNVTDMSWAYYNCTNLTTAVCGDKVTNMSWAYSNCTNLTTVICEPKNVVNMYRAYYNCRNFSIYAPPRYSLTANQLFYANTYGLTSITFTNTENEAYNAVYNIRLHFT